MAEPSLTPDDREERLDEVVAQYLEAAESGSVPDDVTLRAAHPELAGELADFMTVVEQVNRFVGPLRRAVQHLPEQSMPASFGDYELLNVIGRGGMGIVYRAFQKSLKRLVAVKVIQRGLADAARGGVHFRAEAEAAAQLDHPHIVPVYETGEHGEHHFFSMKLFEGGSLAEHLERYQSDPSSAAELVSTIARAVHHAHQRGILHRDLKPANILLDAAGRPHVNDFGLAKWLNPDLTQTQTGLFAGTPSYMAPEQAAPNAEAADLNRVTTATDVYGLGAILYALLTGKPPFRGASAWETLIAVREHEPVRPRTLNPRADCDLETICLKCLDKNPDRRYASAAALADDLDRWLAGESILARPVGRLERVWRWCRRNRLLAGSAATAILASIAAVVSLATGYVFVSRAQQESEQHKQTAELASAKLRERLYASEMTLAFHEWERGELDELQKRLDAFREDEQLHGFEYRWLEAEARARPTEVATYTGHAGMVFCGTFSPDGKTAVTCGEDRSIQFWDAATGGHLRTIRPRPETAALPVKGHTDDENLVRFSPDGSRFVSAGEAGTVRLWNLDAETWQPSPPAHSGEVRALDFSRDGRWLLTGGTDKRILIRDLEHPGSVEEYSGHTAIVTSAAFSTRSYEFASADELGIVRIWNRENRQERLRIEAGGGASVCLAYSPDCSILATGGFGYVKTWNPATGTQLRDIALPTERIRSLTFSNDGARLASVSDSGCVRVWSVADGRLLHRFKAHPTTSWCVSFSPDGQRLLTTGRDHTARIWELSSSRMDFGAAGLSGTAYHVVFSPHGSRLAVGADDRVWVGDRSNSGSLAPLPVEYSISSAPVFSPDGDELAFVSPGGSIRRWSCVLQREQDTSQPPALGPGTGVNWIPESILLTYPAADRLAALRVDGLLVLWREQQRQECRFPHFHGWLQPYFGTTPDGKFLVVADHSSGKVYLWDMATERIVDEFSSRQMSEVGTASFDKKLLAFGSANGDIGLLDLEWRRDVGRLVGYRAYVKALAIAPDRRTIASVDVDSAVRLWNLATGQQLFVIENRRGFPIYSVTFSPDGRYLAVGGAPHQTGGAVSLYDCDGGVSKQ